MKPITIRAIQAGLPKSSMRATTSAIAIHLRVTEPKFNVYNIYMAHGGLFVKGAGLKGWIACLAPHMGWMQRFA
jgi:hypothetical protein